MQIPTTIIQFSSWKDIEQLYRQPLKTLTDYTRVAVLGGDLNVLEDMKLEYMSQIALIGNEMARIKRERGQQ